MSTVLLSIEALPGVFCAMRVLDDILVSMIDETLCSSLYCLAISLRLSAIVIRAAEIDGVGNPSTSDEFTDREYLFFPRECAGRFSGYLRGNWI